MRIPAPGVEERIDRFVVAREEFGAPEHFRCLLERFVIEDRGKTSLFEREAKRFRRSVVPEEKIEEHVRVDDDARTVGGQGGAGEPDEALGERFGKRHRNATGSGKSASVAHGAVKMKCIRFS